MKVLKGEGAMLSSDSAVKIRSEFPALTQKVNGKPLIYLDAAASALKPWTVIERLGHFYTYESANVHRGAYYLSDRATAHFEEARIKVKNFLNAPSEKEIIFTKGTTDSINLVAYSFAETFFSPGDEILLTQMEHHSNIVPWQMIANRKNLKVRFAKVNVDGTLDLNDLESQISDRTKLISLVHCSNTLGTINEIKKVSALAKKRSIPVMVDGAQSVAFMPVDVQDLGIDLFCFSGHKLYGPYGVGVLWASSQLLNQMHPFQGGGSMIREVGFERTTFNDPPYKFEAGTPAIAEVIALGAAIDCLDRWGRHWISDHAQKVSEAALQKLAVIPNLKILGKASHRGPIVSFYFDDCHASDVGAILDQQGVAVRVGHLCTQPLLKNFNLTSVARASFSVFTTEKDLDALVAGLLKAREMLV